VVIVGEYQGDDSSCEGDPCGVGFDEPGTCCIDSSQCMQLTRAACEFKYGSCYMGVVSCEDNPCAPTCSGDLNADGAVDVQDILDVINGFGTSYGVDELLTVISDFGCTT